MIGITLLRVTSDVTWIQLIYIYLYITSINIHILLNVKRPYLFLTREEKIQGKKKKTTSIDCLLLANNNAHGPCRVTQLIREFFFFLSKWIIFFWYNSYMNNYVDSVQNNRTDCQNFTWTDLAHLECHNKCYFRFGLWTLDKPLLL